MKLPELSTTEYGLLGHPLGHSHSKTLFNAKGISYENFDLPALDPAALYGLVLMNPKLKGFNVTKPYKQAIIPLLDKLDPTAAEIGAVNAVKIKRADDGRIIALEGYNTDYEGFKMSVSAFIDGTGISDALILGTGGASKAVAAALANLGINYRFVSRGKHAIDIIEYDKLTTEIMEQNRLIVNTTPLGMYPDTDSCPPIPYEAVTECHKCFDLVYNPAETEFMRRCAARGADVKNGSEMLVAQAKAAYRIWTDNNI